MTKAELIDRIARSRDLPPDVTKKCIAKILELAYGELAAYFIRAKVTKSQNPRFSFPGFGTLTKKKRNARRGVNPRTLEPLEIGACYTLDFKPGAELKKAMNERESAKKTKVLPKKKKSSTRRSTAPASREGIKGVRGRRLSSRDDELDLAPLEKNALVLPNAPIQGVGEQPKRKKTAERSA